MRRSSALPMTRAHRCDISMENFPVNELCQEAHVFGGNRDRHTVAMTKSQQKMLEDGTVTLAPKFPPRTFRHPAASASRIENTRVAKEGAPLKVPAVVCGCGWRGRLRRSADETYQIYLQYEAVRTAVSRKKDQDFRLGLKKNENRKHRAKGRRARDKAQQRGVGGALANVVGEPLACKLSFFFQIQDTVLWCVSDRTACL